MSRTAENCPPTRPARVRASICWPRALSLATALFTSAMTIAAESRLTYVSVSTNAGSGAEILIVGFAVIGIGSRLDLLRGIGSSLSPFGVTGAMADPQLRLFSGTTVVAQNEDWGGEPALAMAFREVGAFALTASSRDAALLENLQPGSYSVHLTSETGSGIALVECYDAGSGSTGAYLSNVSARSVAGSGANILTIGFAISGTEPRTILLRGVGPGLAGFGVTGA